MRATEGILLLPERPTAIMCSNDMTAIGALRVLARAGLNVPRDVSVIGFDDIHLAEFVYPPLTTVRMSRKDLARGAFESLRSVVESLQTAEQRNWTIPTTLIIRESTARAAESPRGATSVKRRASRKRP
jgi:DNA-binding LacI/PurR family transcriptional regulator